MTDTLILKRRDDESLLDWKIRICDNKDKYSLTWENVKELINTETGENFGESVYRKWFYSFFQGLEYAKRKNIESDEVLNELELKKLELLEERKKLQTIRTEYNKIAREKSRRDLLFEHVREGFEKLDVKEPEVDLSYIESEKAFILSFGDIHFGKIFESVNNKYSEEIAMERMNRLIAETVKLLELHDATTLHVLNLADSIEGMSLRVSQMQSLQSGFVDQVIKFSKFYAKWINKLSEYVNVEVHHLTSSNHTELRVFNSSRGEMPKEDMERIIGMYIQDVLENNPRVNVHLYENGFADFNLVGLNVCALHGHQLKGNKNAIKDLSQLHRKFFDILFVAHFHHGNALTVGQSDNGNVEIVQVPSIMGSDEYSDSLMTSSKAGASFHVIEKGKGRTVQHNIILN